MRRLRGALLAALVCLGVVVAWVFTRPPLPEEEPDPVVLLDIDPASISALDVEGPQGRIRLERHGAEWRFADRPFRPSASMVRRIGHQLDGLEARATVDASSTVLEDPVSVTLEREGGSPVELRVGGPNPTGVSYYVQVDGQVYTVAKAAVVWLREPVAAWRETRLGGFDANAVERLIVEVDGARRVFEARGRDWVQVEPEHADVRRDGVRRMLGSLSALRSRVFADHCLDDPACDLVPPRHRVVIEGPEPVEIHFGSAAGEARVYARRAGEGGAHEVSDHVLEILARPTDQLLDRRVVPLEAHRILAIEVDGVAVRRGRDGWRWADGSLVSGATPRRLVEALVAVEGLEPGEPGEDGRSVVLRTDTERIEVAVGPTTEDGTFVVERGGETWIAEGPLPDRIDALLREGTRR